MAQPPTPQPPQPGPTHPPANPPAHPSNPPATPANPPSSPGTPPTTTRNVDPRMTTDGTRELPEYFETTDGTRAVPEDGVEPLQRRRHWPIGDERRETEPFGGHVMTTGNWPGGPTHTPPRG